MKAVILAAGYATRLYPLTIDKPKCLLAVGGVTILDRLIQKLEVLPALDEILLVTNARFFPQVALWQSSRGSKIALRVINDGTWSNETRLGAVGDLGLAVREVGIEDDFLLLASDNLFDQDLSPFVEMGRGEDAVVIGSYDIHDPRAAAGKFGVVELGERRKVVSFEEKPESPKSSLIGMGVYYFPAKSIPWIGEYLAQKNAQDAPGYYVRWLLQKTPIFSFVFSGLWYDIGDLKSLEEAGRLFKSYPQS